MQSSWDATLVHAIVALWPGARGTLSSAHLYRYLQDQAISPPPNGMHALRSVLIQDRQIAGVQGINPQQIATDGALVITWVSDDLAASLTLYRVPSGSQTPIRV